MLQARLHALAGGQGQFIALIGEAGLGKSRLVAEVIQRSPEAFRRTEGRCISFASTSPYLPILEALRGALELGSGAPEAQAAPAARRVPAGAAPFIGTLLGLPLDAQIVIGCTTSASPNRTACASACSKPIAVVFEDLAHHAPLALIVEDLHWADASSLEALERLLPVTGRAPLAIIAAFRPGSHEPSWRFHEAAGGLRRASEAGAGAGIPARRTLYAIPPSSWNHFPKKMLAPW